MHLNALLLRRTLLSSACIVFFANANAADLAFTAVLGDASANVAFPNLPASYTITGSSPSIADAGSAEMGIFLSNAAAANGHWAQADGSWRQFAALNTSAAAGPSRTGTETDHVFVEWEGVSDSSGSGNRTFMGRAGSPLQPASEASWGVFSFNGNNNVEVARTGNVGALGPNLGTGWRFNTSGNPFNRIIPLASARVLIFATVDSPTRTFLQGVVLHEPGIGNRGCAAEQSISALSPGAGLTFSSISSVVAATEGRVYLRGSQVNAALATAEGVWRVCEGAPVAKALANITDARGPGLAASSASFTAMQSLLAAAGGDRFYFGASGQETPGAGAVPFNGIFVHSGLANVPVALRSVQGDLGPKVPGFVFSQFSTFRLQAAGNFGLLRATINDVVTPGTTREGLWRATGNGTAQPIALVSGTGALAPSAARRWVNFQNDAILPNGDVLTLATTALNAGGDQRRGVWRIRPNRAPESIVAIGDRVTLITAAGPQRVAITEVETVLSSSGPVELYSSEDSWVSADGSMIVGVNLAGFGSNTFFVRGIGSDTSVVLSDGFE